MDVQEMLNSWNLETCQKQKVVAPDNESQILRKSKKFRLPIHKKAACGEVGKDGAI